MDFILKSFYLWTSNQPLFLFTYYATEFYYVTRSLHASMAKELEITKKFRKNSRDMSCYSPLEICIEVERKKHKALYKKYKAHISKYVPCILKYMPCFFAASNCLKNIVLY